jgi:hypothetical protein
VVFPWSELDSLGAKFAAEHRSVAHLLRGIVFIKRRVVRPCTLLAEAGCTPSEIAAMLGWTVATVNQMLDVYQSMTAALSDSAVAKLERKAL